ncbi:MAG: hypothetical protein ABJA62_03175 [Luteimonas sp.]
MTSHLVIGLHKRPWVLNALCALLVVAAVLIIAVAHYDGLTLIRGSDSADILLSYFFDASRSIHEEGLWAAMYTPGAQAGIPNWSNPNFHPLYPLYFNWLGPDATVFDTLTRMNAIVLLHLAVLGGGGFYLARRLGVRLIPALCVGLALPWFPAVGSATGWPQIIAGLAWVPWVLAFQSKLYESKTHRESLVGVAGLVVVSALLVYAQPAQNLVLAVFASAFIWLSIGANALLRRDRTAMRAHVVASGWLALAALLIAIACGGYLLEVLRFHARSIRWLGEYGGALYGDQPVPIGAMRLHSLAPMDAWRLLAFEYRKGIGNGYVGAALLTGAVALACQRRASFARALAVCGLLTALFCFSFMAPLLHALVVANKIREITWWSCLAVVCLAPAAAAGFQALSDRYPSDGRPPPLDRWTAALFIALLTGLTALIIGSSSHRLEAAGLLIATFGALTWMRHGGKIPRAARDLAIGAMLFCTVWIPFRYAPQFDISTATVFRADRMQARAAAQHLVATLPDEANYRIALDPTIADSNLLVHSYLTAGLRAIRGGISPADRAKFDLLYFPNAAVSALYGVKYIVLPKTAARSGDWPLDAQFVVRTDASALPRLFFVRGGMQIMEDPVAALRALQDGDPLHIFVAPTDIPRSLDAAKYKSGTPRASTPALSKNDRTQLHAALFTDGPGLLVLNEDPAARWRATVDGQEVLAFRINGFQTAFAIANAGRHDVVIERPGRFSTYRF